ncbi:MAG: Monosaccharide transporter substrate-binding protein family [Frankiales bacterium]|nr:Monosaccharide transporter substrate-binding protein family [Frankiales bacterium]
MRSRVRTTSGAILAVTGLLALSACSSSSSKATPGTSSSTTASSSKVQVGVILPDTTSSARYTQYDAPLLTKAFNDAGVKADVQNAQGDNAKFVSIAQSMISEGVKVLLIDPADPATGISVEASAKAAGIKVIDYDRVNLGGTGDYYVSFDNPSVGKLQAQGLLDCLKAAGKTSAAQVIMLNGGTDIDNNAVQFKAGAHAVLDPAAKAGTIKIAQEVDVSKWENATAATDFQQLLTRNGGKVDGVLAANDGIGGAAIGILKSKSLKVPVTGQDASIQGLQYVLSGDQCMTVFKDVAKEADAASKLAIALVNGDDAAAAALASQKLHDAKGNRDIPYVLLVPEAITKANIKDVVTAGAVTAADLCKGVEAACKAAGVTS